MNNAHPKGKEQRRYIRYWRLLRFVMRRFLRFFIGYAVEEAPPIDAPVLVLANHNTDIDPVLIALSFEKQMRFVASEHIFRWGLISRFINHAFAPIPLIKGRSDVRATMSIMQSLRAGESICIFAEGNRSADGITAWISPATGMLAKAGADLVTFRLEGGYFTHPRWSRFLRRGRMTGRVVGHYTAARLKAMSVDAINEIIRADLHEDAYARQEVTPVAFRGRRLAEHLETVLYLCPACNAAGRLKSNGNRLSCACGLDAKYTETGLLEGVGPGFDTVAKWYAWQQAQVDTLLHKAEGKPIFEDTEQSLYLVKPCQGATLLAKGNLRMTARTLWVAEHCFPLEDIATMAIVGKMTITFSLANGEHYEMKSDHPRSGYKYLHAFEALRKQAALENIQTKEG